jgi:hypothetical protein
VKDIQLEVIGGSGCLGGGARQALRLSSGIATDGRAFVAGSQRGRAGAQAGQSDEQAGCQGGGAQLHALSPVRLMNRASV